MGRTKAPIYVFRNKAPLLVAALMLRLISVWTGTVSVSVASVRIGVLSIFASINEN